MQGKNKRFTSVPFVNESVWRRRGIVAWALLGMAGVFVVVSGRASRHWWNRCIYMCTSYQ